jgi:hypothetical protein
MRVCSPHRGNGRPVHGSRTFYLLPFVHIQTLFKSRQKSHTHPPPPRLPTITQRPREGLEAPRALQRCRRMSCDWSWTSCGGWRASPSAPASRPSSPTRSATLKLRLRHFFISSIFAILSILLFSPPISFSAWVDYDPFLPILSLRCLIEFTMADGEGN